METGYLIHYGVKGMKWGVRRAAKKDAKESARSKMYYGEGAGTRRKLIKAKVESRSKHDPNYKKAYEYYMQKQDLGKHASKAVSERHRKDAANTAKRYTKAVKNRIFGVGAAGTIAAGVAAYQAYKNPEIRKLAKRSFKTTTSKIKGTTAFKKGRALVNNAVIKYEVNKIVKDTFKK